METFSTTDAQVKLFTVAISTSIAVILVLLNQWLTRRKSRKELLITKLEELADNIYAYTNTAEEILYQIYTLKTDEHVNKIADEGTSIHRRIKILTSLYFPCTSLDDSLLKEIGWHAIDDLRIGGVLEENFEIDNSSYNDLIEEIKKYNDNCESHLKRLIKKHV